MGIERQRRAGLERPKARLWTIEVMVGAIYALKEIGKPINAGYLIVNHNYLYQAMLRSPGGWKKVVEIAGFNPEKEKAVNLGSLGRATVWDNDY